MVAVKVGKKVPAFSAVATTGVTVASKDLRGAPYVLYFYPKDATPGCTREGQGFRDLHGRFARLGVRVFGVSRDSLVSHEKFKAKQGFSFELIADTDERLCGLFDVIREKNMYGRRVLGIERSTFLVDAEGVLRQEWRKVKVDGHPEAVLAAAQALR